MMSGSFWAAQRFMSRPGTADCGTGLFCTNDVILPGVIDVQSAAFDAADTLPPQAHVQIAERLAWMENVRELATYERYPPRG
jgi:hypothetical protein